MNMLQDRVRGSLIGGAIGDALGYPVEFNSYTEIVRRYGERGITRLETEQRWLSENKQVGKAPLCLKVYQQVYYLRLDGYVQSGDGLIADYELWFGGKGCDAEAPGLVSRSCRRTGHHLL